MAWYTHVLKHEILAIHVAIEMQPFVVGRVLESTHLDVRRKETTTRR
jgi:hypothetical protein